MIEKMLDADTKAVVLEITDVFLNMNVESIPEDYPKEDEATAHITTITLALRQGRKDGFTRYALYTREEAEARQQDIGRNGLYLLILKKEAA